MKKDGLDKVINDILRMPDTFEEWIDKQIETSEENEKGIPTSKEFYKGCKRGMEIAKKGYEEYYK